MHVFVEGLHNKRARVGDRPADLAVKSCVGSYRLYESSHKTRQTFGLRLVEIDILVHKTVA